MRLCMRDQSTMNKPTVSEFLSQSKLEILTLLGGIYEHSPWIAEKFYVENMEQNEANNGTIHINNVNELFMKMSSVVDNSTYEQKLLLLRAHPDLCTKIDNLKSLTKASQDEQSSAGLHTMTDEERNKFAVMNSTYREKFGFPFILAVKNATKHTVLAAVEGRIQRSKESEFDGALHQVHKIAWMRLLSTFHIQGGQKGFLTCHVLDTCHGIPAANMRIQLRRLTPAENSGLVNTFVTNSDGRLEGGPALKNEDFQLGTYELLFFAGDYFAQKNTKMTGIPFLNEIPIRFGIDDPEEHYHVPLLVSPWSYSTYRGS